MATRAPYLALVLAGCATAAGHNNAGDIDARIETEADAADVDAPARPDIDAAPGTPDAAPGAPDAMADAMVPAVDAMLPTAGPVHLLLSEVQLAPTGGEFVEIVNPTQQPVVLDHYYLTDNGTYFKLPAGTQTIDAGDFIARFKAGETIPGHGVITISMESAASFQAADGVAPTYSIADGTMTVVASNGTPGLSNTGEMVALFYWDGASDLVTDVDVMIAAKASTGNGVVAKSGIAIDGPDADSTPSTYKSDADTIANQAATAGSAKSTKRTALETGHETAGGAGNGVGGDDETSEATGTTWDSSAFTAPTPGTVPAALLP